MSNPYFRVEDPEGCDSNYEVLTGPNGFKCMLTEPEDRTWFRDGKHVVVELNRLHALLVKACIEIARIRRSRYTGDKTAKTIAGILEDYGIRLRLNGEAFEEDVGK